jgi:uncharacterized protein (DUF488 family)
MIKLFTIGFTKKPASTFFEKLKSEGVKKIIDTRLNNTSQLSGFAKQADLQYFLKQLADIDYQHQLSLAPTQDILSAYKKKTMSWEDYSHHYLDLIKQRKIETSIQQNDLNNCCFLCSEDKPHYCHRRLAAEYLQSKLTDVEIIHL